MDTFHLAVYAICGGIVMFGLGVIVGMELIHRDWKMAMRMHRSVEKEKR